MSESSTNSDFDLVDNNDIDIQTKLNNLLIEFNEEKEKNVKLQEQMNEINASYEKNMGELKNKLERLSKNCKRAGLRIPIPFSQKFGILNIILIFLGFNKYVDVCTQNNFIKPEEECNNYSLFYFEVKVKIEGEKNGYNTWLNIGLKNGISGPISLRPGDGVIENERCEVFKIEEFSWIDGDIFGCGLVYPPKNKSEKFPYIFFTQNGNQIGKAILLRDNFDPFKPYVCSRCCSAEANFGNNLETKPFCYDITKNFVIKEFYEDSEVD
ncbi:unnamed protein product [Meloidogyne enterolobii]|uniref:Uncharacterized protein n=1 Tax=Meloidogyne enterolobii TaxID=390850 RepID=A0ACB0YLE2_MELEN